MDKPPTSPTKAPPSTPPVRPMSISRPSATSTSEPRPSSSSSSLGQAVSSQKEGNANRLSMQPRRTSNVPKPAPIPIPEPVVIPPNSTSGTAESSGEGPSSHSSTGSALGNVSAELIQAITIGGQVRSTSGSPTSPKETNNLLGDGSSTPRSFSSPRALPSGSLGQRPRSALDSSAASGLGVHSQYDSVNNRPHSSADAWATRPPSITSTSGEGTLNPQSRSQSPSAESVLKKTFSTVPRSRSSNFINTPSPLNPNALSIPRRPGSSSSRPASMVLYRLAGVGDDFNPPMSSLAPPVTTNSRRASRFSTLSSSNSVYSVFGDSKYPMPANEDGTLTPPPSGAFLAYEYDPSWDQDAPDDAEDALHKPDEPGTKEPIGAFNLRGFCNIFVMVAILLSLICLFALYPIISYYDAGARSVLLTGTDHSNNPNGGSTPNVTSNRGPNDLIDPDTPDSAKTWTGLGNTYRLVFSDEFKQSGRNFGPSSDPFWEAVETYDRKNQDLNAYAPQQVTTENGHLVIALEHKSSGGQEYVSGMLQSWNKFCFTGGYIEVAVSLPGDNTQTGFNPQVYTMGNLARSGFAASEEGIFPYSYDTCDEATQANQSGDGTLSTLPAQRLSGCSCPVERTRGNHPGPTGDTYLRGRGAPQIDVLGYATDTGHLGVVSQGLRIAPMNAGRVAGQGQAIQDATNAQLNTYHGSTTQEVISALTNVPSDSYVNGGAQFTAYGYQHVPNADDQSQATLHFIRGSSNEMYRITGAAVPAAAGVGQRLISNEPMYITLALALSNAIAQVDTTTLNFPAKLLVDYVRVYQPDGADSKVTCNPTDFPTADYISKHERAYTDASQTTWAGAGYEIPTSAYLGEC